MVREKSVFTALLVGFFTIGAVAAKADSVINVMCWHASEGVVKAETTFSASEGVAEAAKFYVRVPKLNSISGTEKFQGCKNKPSGAGSSWSVASVPLANEDQIANGTWKSKGRAVVSEDGPCPTGPFSQPYGPVLGSLRLIQCPNCIEP